MRAGNILGAYRDYGGNASGRLVPKKGHHRGRCTSCETECFVSIAAWSRRTRPLCPSCGALLEPSPTGKRAVIKLRDAGSQTRLRVGRGTGLKSRGRPR